MRNSSTGWNGSERVAFSGLATMAVCAATDCIILAGFINSRNMKQNANATLIKIVLLSDIASLIATIWQDAKNMANRKVKLLNHQLPVP